jgi:ATP-dependent Clp protease ATP-binding subunit ClpC
VVLFDEIEKAHPDLFNILLQVLDDGCLTDSLGRKVDFKNTVLIMTSNIGTRLLDKGSTLGFQKGTAGDHYQKMREQILSEMKKSFNPEFINRIDETVIFHTLDKEHLLQIIDLLVADLNRRLLEKGIQLDVTPDVKSWLIKEGYQPTYGARPMRRCIQRNIEDPLSEELIRGRFKENKRIKAVLKDNLPAFVEEEAMAGV